jgi:hypothetical protein
MVVRAVHQLSALWFADITASWATGFVIPGPQQTQLGNWVCHGRAISKSVEQLGRILRKDNAEYVFVRFDA